MSLSLWAIAGGLALSGPLAQAHESCPNELSRQGPSVALPDCRAYEQVTPVDKRDALDIYGTTQEVLPTTGNGAYVAENGEALLLHTRASFGPQAPVGEAAYVFSRGAQGWSTHILSRPIDQPQEAFAEIYDPFDLSEVGFLALSGTFDELFSGDESAYQHARLVGPPGGPYSTLLSASGFTAAGEVSTAMVGGSQDLSKVIIESENKSLAPGAEELDEGSHALYESEHGAECASEKSSCKLVNVNNEGKLLSRCGASLGVVGGNHGGTYSAVSSDGSKVFFTAPYPEAGKLGVTGPGCWSGTPPPYQQNPPPEENPPEVYMREDGMRTAEVSAPEEGVKVAPENPENPRYPAIFVGASSDGSKVFFMTKTQLTKNATGHAQELYEYETISGKLTLISGGESGTSEGNVRTVGAVSSDGSAVYFSAFGKLAPEATTYPPSNGGSINLYRYDTVTGQMTFITTLGAYDYPIPGSAGEWATEDWYENEVGDEYSGAKRENLDPEKEWYATGNGQFLLFASPLPLTGFDNVKTGEVCQTVNPGHNEFLPYERCLELFRYDAATGKIVCVSCFGGRPLDDAVFAVAPFESPASGPPRPISENGADVFFSTDSALLPQATAGKVHVYEWHDGTLSMISPPNDPGNAFFLGSSANGANVFFTTHAQLTPEDTDESGDIYDARVDGGFQGLIPPQCTGTGCQGVPAAPPIFATPASVTFEGVGNFETGSQSSGEGRRKPASKPTKCKRRQVRKHGKCVGKKAKKSKRSAKGKK